MNVWGKETEYFYELTPDVVDSAVKSLGLRPSGRVMALNSLENRVFDVEVTGLDDLAQPFSKESVVVKFYRPGRWSNNAIIEEHKFLNELTSLEIPVAPVMHYGGQSLFVDKTSGLRFSLFPKVRGRLKDEYSDMEIEEIGRLLGRIHHLGASATFSDRPKFTIDNYFSQHLTLLESLDFLPKTLLSHYLTLTKQIATLIAPYFEALPVQRLHGDLHRGNILWTSEGPYVTDFDDSMTGPREQDLWLLLPGSDDNSKRQQEIFMDGYHQMNPHHVSLNPFIIEVLRTIRMVHFAGWIGRRFDDPTFKDTFCGFPDEWYWEMQVQDMRMQISQLQDLISVE